MKRIKLRPGENVFHMGHVAKVEQVVSSRSQVFLRGETFTGWASNDAVKPLGEGDYALILTKDELKTLEKYVRGADVDMVEWTWLLAIRTKLEKALGIL